jgi:hypothetical protein
MYRCLECGCEFDGSKAYIDEIGRVECSSCGSFLVEEIFYLCRTELIRDVSGTIGEINQ